MHETEVEPAFGRTRKPGRWVWRAAVAVFVAAVLIFGLRVWRFYEAVDAVKRHHGYLRVERLPGWLGHFQLDGGRAELFFAEEITVVLNGKLPPYSASLSLSRVVSPLEDEGLKELVPHLRELENLRYLNLSRAKITDQGLSSLSGFHRLLFLDISGTEITDTGLTHLAGLKNLRKLNLDDCDIGDEGLRHLHGLQNLESLNLDGTQVTDEGVRGLKALKNLRFLSLAATGITDDACEELRGAIPDLEILDD